MGLSRDTNRLYFSAILAGRCDDQTRQLWLNFIQVYELLFPVTTSSFFFLVLLFLLYISIFGTHFFIHATTPNYKVGFKYDFVYIKLIIKN